MEFPIRERYAFFNHAGVAPIPVSTQAAISEFARDAAEEGPVNYSAWLHAMSMAREAAGTLINADPDDICFIKNTNHGLIIAANSVNWKPGDNVVGFAHEFPANVLPWKNLSHFGVEFRAVQEKEDHSYDFDQIVASIDSRTRLLAVSWVEYSTGIRNDIDKLSELCREKGILFCVDAIQGLGVLPFDVQKTPVDFAMADGHKWLLAPEGCGILYVNPRIINDLNTSMTGWCGVKNPQDYDNSSQPYKPNARRFEEGSHNLLAINALGTSIRLLLSTGKEEVERRVRALTTHLIEGAKSRGYTVVTPEDWNRRAGIVSLSKPGIDVAVVARMLQDENKIIVAGRRGFIRVSPHFYNDTEEIDRLVRALP
jgi:selenocysteine lyase/cysteine desulfurase